MCVGGGKDYTLESSIVRFTAGMITIPLNVTISDDDDCENNERFVVAINPYSYSLLTDVAIGDYCQATVTILDDDCE